MRGVSFVRVALKVVMKNYWDFVDVILIYVYISKLKRPKLKINPKLQENLRLNASEKSVYVKEESQIDVNITVY
jgi:hypothetical protein